jgi:hypothetical protein
MGMQLRLATRYTSLIFVSALIGLLVYVGLAFLPYPPPISPGLEPSWTYAISRAVKDGLIFGKDIIFTYGPFGYLMTGVALDPELLHQATIFRLIVHICLLIAASIKIITLKTNWQRLAIAISIIFAYLSALFGTDYQLLFIFIILLSFDNLFKRFPLTWVLIAGVLSGFFLLTKFTTGVLTIGSSFLFIIGCYLDSNHSRININKHAFALLTLLLAASSTTFTLLAPAYYWINFRKVLICLAISIFIGIFTGIAQKYTYRFYSQFIVNENQFKSKSTINNYQGFQAWPIAFYISYGILIISTILRSSPSLIDFLKHSLEISSGYSSSMSIVDSRSLFLVLGISSLFLTLLLTGALAFEGNLGFTLPLLLILLLTFKHGFVRQDAHIVLYAYSFSFIVSIIGSTIKKIAFQKIAIALHLYLLVIVIIFFNNSLPHLAPLEKFANAQLNPAKILQSHWVFDLDSVTSNVISNNLDNLTSLGLQSPVNQLLKNKTVDIVPTETLLAAVNDFNWVPRPIFQSYSAYTKKLDDINFKSITETPRDYILYDFMTIDQRHPFFDEPRTLFHLYCNYQLPLNFSTFIGTPVLPELMLLEQRNKSRCLPERMNLDSSTSWNTLVSVSSPGTGIVRANIEIQYSVFGKLFKALFRAAPVIMHVNYNDGSSHDYRIIPENSNNGVIVSHLPKNHQEALLFWQGQLVANVKAFNLQATNPFLYKPTVHIQLTATTLKN